MKKITSEIVKEFITSNKMQFVPTQPKMCIPIINRLCQKMLYGIKFDDIKTCDNLIIDGHHRYLSAMIMNFDIGQVLSHKTSATKSFAWNVIGFDENDWDTYSKISHLNELDAIYNKLEIEFVRQITSG